MLFSSLFRLYARWRIARGDTASVLRGRAARDLPILAEVGLFQSVLKGRLKARGWEERFAVALALAATGEVEEGIALARAVRSQLNARDKRRFAQAVGVWAPEAGLEWVENNEPGLRAALLDHAGRIDAADARASGMKGPAPDACLLRANRATRAEHFADAAQEINALYTVQGMAAPFMQEYGKRLSFQDLPTDFGGSSEEGPLLTIIMPAQDVQDYIGTAVRSVLGQTWRNIELLIVDDASTDGTVAAAEAAIGGDPRARIIHQQQAQGPYVARNVALREAQGEYVTFHDADDWSHPQRFARQMKTSREGKAPAVTIRGFRITAEGLFTQRRVYPLVRWSATSLLAPLKLVLERVGPFDEVMTGADSEYVGRLKAILGGRAHVALPDPSLILAARATSLTGAAETGFSREAAVQRLAYWEAWHWRHARQEYF